MNKRNKSIKLNFIMNAILTMSQFIFPLITFPYVSRVLLPIGTGKVSFATSVIMYFNIFAQLGIPTYGIRACAKVRDDKEQLSKTVQELLIINLTTTFISYLALFICLIFVPRLQEDRLLFIIISSMMILNAIGMEWLYKALEEYTYITIRSIVFKFISVITMFLLIHQQSDYVKYGFITIIASNLSFVLNFINAKKYISFKKTGTYDFKKHLQPIFVFFAMACATTIYTNLDTVMLGVMKTDADVGYYNAAVKIKTILVSVVTSLGTVLLPRCSYYVENNLMDEFKRICTKALNFVFLLAAPLTIYFILYASNGIYFLSGNEYTNSILPMQIIMPTILLIGITNILGIQILIPLGKEKVVLYSEIVGAIIDLVINFLLIPKFASAGAAFGTLIAEIAVLVVQYWVLKDQVKDSFKSIAYWKIGMGICIGCLLSIWIRSFQLSHFLTLILSGSLFFGGYGLFLLATKESLVLEIFLTILNKLKKS